MDTGFIVFARMTSKRLPGKSLVDIAGEPLIGHVLARARRIARRGAVVLATSSHPEDDELENYATAAGVSVFRGALDDVAQRAIECCRSFGFTRFARICGDRPFFDPQVVETLLDFQEQFNLDLATNATEKTYPPGLTAEVVKRHALERIMTGNTDSADREHVTRAFYRQSSKFLIRNIRSPIPLDLSLSLVVDTEIDLQRARWIAARCTRHPTETLLPEILTLARQWYAENRQSPADGVIAEQRP